MKKALLFVIGILQVANILCEESVTVKHPIKFNGKNIELIWTNWSPRVEISPSFELERNGHVSKNSLKISTKKVEQFGAWRTRVDGIMGGHIYRFSAWYKTKNVANERRSVIARLQWIDKNGKLLIPPEYAIDVEKDGKWTKVQYITKAPDTACAVDVQLSHGFSANSSVLWDDISFVEQETLPSRPVRVATIFFRPRNTKSPAESVQQFCSLVEKYCDKNADIVCLPEGITVVGTGKSYADVSESIPGPTTERLGMLARKINAYIVAGLYERSGNLVYNTAVLINRDGRLLGAYRKTHLPREEWEAGITHGNTYPVFETEFGKIGIIICWDVQFPEPSRAMCAKGAEILFLPIWGGNEILAKARAIENSVFLVSSTYDMKSFIVDPTGTVLAEATQDQPVVITTIDLDKIYYQPWLGNMKTRTWKEWRPELRW